MLSLGNKLTLTTQPIYKFVNEHSVVFDGSDQCIVTDGADTVLQNTTYSFWCKSSTNTTNQGVFGHGASAMGGFHFNGDGARPLLYLAGATFRYWNDTSAQDDGEWHHWVVYLDTDINNSKLYVDGVLQTPSYTISDDPPQAYTESLTIGGDKAVGGNYFEGKIDEFAVYDRELTQAEITRMYNTYYSPNRVANGNFSQIGNEEVTNGDFSQIGSELVPSIASIENAGGGTITQISGNSYSSISDSTSGSGIRPKFDFATTSGKTYKLVITPTGTITGTINFDFYDGSSYLFQNYDFTTTKEIYFTDNGSVFGAFDGTQTYNITGFTISIKEVGQDWTFGSAWSTDNTKAIYDDSAINSITQNLSLSSGKSYKIQFQVNDSSGSGARMKFGNAADSVVFFDYAYYTDGLQTLYYNATSNSTDFNIKGHTSGSSFNITNISIKEVGQHWTVSNSDADNYVVFNGSTARLKFLNTSPITELGFQNLTLNAGTTYKIIVDVASVTSGSIKIDTVGISEIFDTAGVTTRIVTPTSNTSSLSFYRNTADVDITLNSVVIQELKHDATNLMLNHSEYQSANPLITSTKSMQFDGVDNFMEIQDSSNLQLEASPATWTFWTRLDSLSGGDQKFLAKAYATNTSTSAYQIRTDDDDLKLQCYDGSWNTFTASSFFTDLNWVNVTITLDSSNLASFYKNGVLFSSGSLGADIAANSGQLLFGARTPNSEEHFLNGEMTEVGIYNRCLTSLEVASLYNQGVPTNLLVSRGDYVATGLQGYWKMGDGTNDEYPVIYDQVNPTLGSDLVTGDNSATTVAGAYTDVATNWAATINDVLAVTFTLGGNYRLKLWSWTYYTPIDSSIEYNTGTHTAYVIVSQTTSSAVADLRFNNLQTSTVGGTISNITVKKVNGNLAYMTNMVEGNITNQYPLTKIRNYYRMGDGILDGYPIIQDQTSPNLAHIPTTNLVTYSEDFSQSYWVKSASQMVLASSITDPFGTQKSYKLQTLNCTNQSYSHVTITSVVGKKYSFSVYAKKGDYDYVSLVGLNPVTIHYFNLANGTAASSGGITPKIYNVGNGWFRCEVTLECDNTSKFFGIYLAGDSGDISLGSVADGNGIYVTGVQVEEQSQATGYIKSDGIAAVRKSSTTNLETKSNGFSTWTSSSGATATANYIVSPDGTQNAARIQFTSNGFLYNTAQGVSSTLFTISCYAKRNDSGTQSVGFFTNGSGTVDSAWSLTSDWKRFTYTYTSTNTSNIGIAGVGGADVSVFGFQIEHQTQAETYVPTYGLPVTIDLFTENNYGTMTNMSSSDIIEDTPNN